MHRAVSLDDIDAVRFAAVRQALGVETFGINEFELPPAGFSKLHDEAATAQEEVYAIVGGSGEIVVDDKVFPVSEGQYVRVPPSKSRQLRAGEQGLRYIAIGAAEGRYDPPLGAPGLHTSEAGLLRSETGTAGEVPAVEVRRLRHVLGVTAFGVNHFTLPPHVWHKRHDESHTGQQELYLVLEGAGEIVFDDDEVELLPGRYVLVEPYTTRQIRAGADGLSLVVFGGTAGRAYAPPW